MLVKKNILRKITDSPKFFLGSNWINEDERTKVLNEAHIIENTHEFIAEYGSLCKEIFPARTKSHSLNHFKNDDYPLPNASRQTIC